MIRILKENFSTQIPVPFKLYADFECILKKVEYNSIDSDIECTSDSSYTKKYQDHIPCSFPYKVVCVDNKFRKKMFYTQEKMLLMNLLNQFLVSTIIAEK